MTGALIWKEWMMLRWKLMFMVLFVGAFTAIGLQTRILQDEAIFNLCGYFCIFIVPVFVAMSMTAEERQEGTLSLQMRMPVPAGRIYLVKLITGLAVTAAPILVSMAIALMLASDREWAQDMILRIYVSCLLFGLHFFIWLTVFSLAVRHEAKVAVTGIIIISGWTLPLLLDTALGLRQITMLFSPWGYVMAAAKQYEWLKNAKGDNQGLAEILAWLLVSGVQFILLCVLILWGRRRFEALAWRQK